MLVDCPECGASLAGNPGAEMVCPACMTPFLVPAAERAVRAFDVQPAGDAVIQGMSRHAIREAIYTGRLDAAARVRHGGGRWELIGGYPEFAAVFRLLGGDLAPMAGTRKLAGWGKGRAGEETGAHPRPAPSSRPNPALRTPTLVPPPPPGAPPPPLPAATAPATAARVAAADAVSAGLVAAAKPAASNGASSGAAPKPAAATAVATLPGDERPSRGPWLVVGGIVVAAIVAAAAMAG